MSAPRYIVAGRTWMITRRTTRRHYLLRPDADRTIQQLYWYVTAVYAAKFGIQLHAVQMMSTHIHEVLTDVRGVLPNFVRERNRAFANALKVHRKWPEEVFQRAAAHYLALHGCEAVLQQIAYTLANCVLAGLVDTPDRWPGVTVVANDIGTRIVRTVRPNIYFNADNPLWPAVAEIAISVPESLESEFGFNAARKRLREAVGRAVRMARTAAREAGHIARTVSELYRAEFTRRATSIEKRFQRAPIIAAAGDSRVAASALNEIRRFRSAYRTAREKLRRGLRDIRFPDGTWRWRVELLPHLSQP